MANHSEEYKEVRDGAITYFENPNKDYVIESFKKSKDNNTRIKVTMLDNQQSEHREAFLNSMEEFEALRAKIEANAKKETGKEVDVSTREIQKPNGDKEITIQVDENGDTNEDGNVEEEKDIATQIDGLAEKAKAMEEVGKLLEGDINSVNGLKNSLMSECVDTGVILEARASYEHAQDEMNMRTAKHIIEKNILVSQREKLILEVKIAIDRGENETAVNLGNKIEEKSNQIDELDQTFANEFPVLQSTVSNAYQTLQNTTKEVITKVEADFKNSYKLIRSYSESAILQSEKLDLTKNLNRIALNTAYSENILANGKQNSISAYTVNVNGNEVKVISTEHSHGVDTSFLDGNTELLRTGAGNIEFETRGKKGDLVPQNPDEEETLKRMGIESIEDIYEAKEEIDEKAENKDEIDEEYEPQAPSLYYTED